MLEKAKCGITGNVSGGNGKVWCGVGVVCLLACLVLDGAGSHRQSGESLEWRSHGLQSPLPLVGWNRPANP